MRSVLQKRGQEMSISTLVLIVLAIVVLVLVIIGFTGGWQNLWDRITNVGGGKANVQTIVQACQIACTSNSQYDYCTAQRSITLANGNKNVVTCNSLARDRNATDATTPLGIGDVGLNCAAITC